MSLDEQVRVNIKKKYEYLTIGEIETCYNMALHDYMRLRYPSENGRPPVDKIDKNFMVMQWVYASMEDILSRAGGTNVTSYKENGISFTFASSYIDPVLVAQIMPKAGVPR